MVEIKILVKGIHKHVEGSGDNKVFKIGSTVTLIKSNKNIIVDAGYFPYKDELVKNLKAEGLNPEDIDVVILTHPHLDHVANTHLFTKAKIFCKFNLEYPGQFHDPAKGYVYRVELAENTVIADDVKIILTPGHTFDMISVIVQTKQGVVVIAGDAISSEEFTNLEKEPPTMLIHDLNKYNASRKKILKIADYIIPGHGDIFKVTRQQADKKNN